MSSSDRVQTVRNAWINALRAEVLRKGAPAELPRIANVGVWLATYTDADGGGAFPSRETLAALAGCSSETVTRVVRVLMAVGMLGRKRRPNQSSVYQLLMPVERPDWHAHIHLYTDTRQRRDHAKRKAQQAAEAAARAEEEATRKASEDAVRKASMDCVPEGVHGGVSEPSETAPEGVHGRPRKTSPDAFRKASMAGPYQYNHLTVDPDIDHTPPEPGQQPPVRAGARGENDHPPAELPDFIRCADCGTPMINRPGRTRCARHTDAERTAS